MTKLNYLKNTYLFKSNWNINEVWKNEYWNFVILNETIFYPQGWWQPTDTGKISNSNGSFIVNNVRLDQNWVVYHYWNFENWNFSIWEKVEEEINSENRINNAKRHSAWHLIDVAVENLWITNIKPTKWFHFPEGCYVEYEWTLEIEKEELTKKLNEELKKLIWENIEIIEENPDKNLDTPTWKKPRFITFKWYKWHWCWGTHIKNSSEIWNINVRKIKEKGWNIKISYEVV
jgi:Ser-tRNA(Ala) deacylase AlaX